MKSLRKTKPILFIGDHHGTWFNMLQTIKDNEITDCYLISVGDSGIGFKNKSNQLDQIQLLNKEFKSNNIIFMSIRGNHDDPAYFKHQEYNLSNFQLIEDYTVMKYGNKLIQFIGGATSIDRTGRKEGVTYWKDEGCVFNKNNCQKVDILVTHTAPQFCFPQAFNEMVYGWAKEDAYLLEDLTEEREIMDQIFTICQPTLHLYGHFHSSWTEKIGNCHHRLLNIDEIWEAHI